MTGSTIAEPNTAEAVFEACKAALFPILAEHAIARVLIGCDSEGDEGQINDISAFSADGALIELPKVDAERHQLNHDGTVTTGIAPLEDALDSFAEEALCALYSGWENGSGACGELELLVESRSVTLTHNSRFIDFDTDVTEL